MCGAVAHCTGEFVGPQSLPSENWAFQAVCSYTHTGDIYTEKRVMKECLNKINDGTFEQGWELRRSLAMSSGIPRHYLETCPTSNI